MAQTPNTPRSTGAYVQTPTRACTSTRTSTNTPVKLSHVSLFYEGGITALDDISLEIAQGERVCILGANGSGKSTLASVIAGLLAPDTGEVTLAGRHVFKDDRPNLNEYRLARRSLGLVFQNPDDQIVTSIVEDDVAFGPENLGLAREEISSRVARELHRVALDDYAHSDPTRLSGGQKQRVAIAGALAMEPRVLVLDEPSSLLDVRGRAAILRVMQRLSKAGITLVHVTHFMEEALEADCVIVLDHGRMILKGTPEEVFSHDKQIREIGLEEPFAATLSRRLGLPWTCDEQTLLHEISQRYDGTSMYGTGSTTEALHPTPQHPAAPSEEQAIVVEHVSFSYGGRTQALTDISFDIAPGTSTAIIGQTGSGKSTLLRIMTSLEKPDKGRVLIGGNDTSTRRGRKAARHIIGYVMQHPERQLFAESVEKDVAFGPLNLGLPTDEIEQRVVRSLEIVGLSELREASPFKLSGGQRRLCAIAGVLAMQPTILVLDEPTAGLDPRSRAMLRCVLNRLYERGITLVLVTHSMEDAARSDRIIVLDQSHLMMSGTPAEVFSRENEERLAAVGLGIPHPLQIARKLERYGMDSLGNPLTTNELVAAINRITPGEKDS